MKTKYRTELSIGGAGQFKDRNLEQSAKNYWIGKI